MERKAPVFWTNWVTAAVVPEAVLEAGTEELLEDILIEEIETKPYLTAQRGELKQTLTGGENIED
jgi:hypothetical protein